MAKNETTKTATKIVAVINKDRKWTPAYTKGEIMKAGERFECNGRTGYYINKAGELVLTNLVGHGWHEVVAPEDFDIFIEETVTVTTKTVTKKRAMIKGKHIVPAAAE